jgi:hypothetical protein
MPNRTQVSGGMTWLLVPNCVVGWNVVRLLQEERQTYKNN